jgi:hypothetical protein
MMKRLVARLLGSIHSPEARRRSPHCRALPNRASLRWRGERRACYSRARLLDIRNMWHFIIADRQPPEGQAVWVRVEGPTPTGWAEATVVRRSGHHRVASEFRGRPWRARGAHQELESQERDGSGLAGPLPDGPNATAFIRS